MKVGGVTNKRERLRIFILKSTIKVVGRYGYAKATMARTSADALWPTGCTK